MSTVNEKNTPEPLSFAAFLESFPPGAERPITDLCIFSMVDVSPSRRVRRRVLNAPDIQLHCATEMCCGIRTFECLFTDKNQLFYGDDSSRGDFFLTYYCRNCGKGIKRFALRVHRKAVQSGSAMKYGEIPAFGPPLPTRLSKIVGDDYDLLLKGRCAENQSLGIGAFAYYRRVVENKKDRLLKEIRKAAVRLKADQELLDKIDLAIGETQFSKSLDLVKDAIPDGLKVHGDNPLKLLHGALSNAVHNLDDDECLERAQAVRVVLSELVSNIAHILKDEREVKAAVKKLQSVT